jgi:cytochrome c oxidase subunit 2
MKNTSQNLTRWAIGVAFLMAWLAVDPAASFASAPLNYLSSFGSKADSILNLTWGLLIISILVVVVMTALVLWAVFRSRSSVVEEGEVGSESPVGSSFNIFGLGLGVTVLILAGSVVWTMVTLAAIDRPSQTPTLSIEITGHQWWWKVRYLSDKPSEIFNTANEIHIPAGIPVKVMLRSRDVIHSFWVPALSGKTDLIPGQVNTTWIEAHKPGVYLGQCTEYCGLQHSHMALRVVAQAPEKFEAWRQAQLKSAEPPKTDDGKAGLAVFERRCAGCHTVRGTQAGGAYGPDLSHLMTRASLADGTVPNAGGYLAGWIADPQHVKPGTRMPRVALSGEELQAVTNYLRTLH